MGRTKWLTEWRWVDKPITAAASLRAEPRSDSLLIVEVLNKSCTFESMPGALDLTSRRIADIE
jgi:hypothetical protein